MTQPPCIGCGYCCSMEPCLPAEKAGCWDERGGCRFLVWEKEKNRYICKMIEIVHEQRPDIKIYEAMGVGLGCLCEENPRRLYLLSSKKGPSHEL
jgi:hypothetical protein